jgi:tRNA pseudouridine13 synthase
VLSTALHTNKLRTGHLAGNRFRIRIREVGPDAEARSRAVLEILSRRGVPNYYGGQRFGMREDNDRVGAALARGDTQEVFAILLGRPNDTDPPAETAARTAYDAGDLARAKGLWPGNRRDARRILDAVMRRGPSPAALKAIDRRMVRLYVSALQSRIFNEVLARRVDQIDRVQTGDLAQKTDSGGVFLVEVVAAEAPRAAAGEISPTGPLPGSRARLAEGEPGRVEREILAAFGLEEGGIPRVGPLKVKGTRRALRFLPESVASEAGSDEHGAYLEIRFAAPPGSYATVLLREIMKVDVP